VLRLYGDNYSEVLKLNKIKKWDGSVPKVSAVEDKNQSVNAIKKEDEKLNETNNKSVDTRKEEDLKN
jgi:hypothetical protein